MRNTEGKKRMYRAKRLTPICRIGSTKPVGDEWASYSKKIVVDGAVEYATLELESDGVCGMYLNGEFIEGHMGRMPGRVFFCRDHLEASRGGE